MSVQAGARIQVVRGVSWVRSEPSEEGSRESQLLHGERFEVEAVHGDWAAGRCAHDGFPGFVRLADYAPRPIRPSHGVIARSAPVLPEPYLRTHPIDQLSVGSGVKVTGERDQFFRRRGGGWIYKVHLAPWPPLCADLATAVEVLRGAPFVWGGRSSFGLDCSGFIQLAHQLVGRPLPRDLDEQAKASVEVPRARRAAGDLVFARRDGQGWFHAGILVDERTIAHAGRRFAGVGSEPFSRFVRGYDIDKRVRGSATVEITILRLEAKAAERAA